ncbi:MAG: DUF4156 domain-containing protein [Bdellovibrionota bacterium]
MKSRVLFAMLLFASACSSTPLTPEGKNTRVVSSLPPEDAKKYSEIGVVVASETYQHDGDEKDCRNQLQNRAGYLGADVLVLETSERKPCVIGLKQACVQMTGRAFRKNE